jgi:hypothetical protein
MYDDDYDDDERWIDEHERHEEQMDELEEQTELQASALSEDTYLDVESDKAFESDGEDEDGGLFSYGYGPSSWN